MPEYLYRCDKCQAETDVKRSMQDPDETQDTQCPSCEAGALKRIYTPYSLGKLI